MPSLSSLRRRRGQKQNEQNVGDLNTLRSNTQTEGRLRTLRGLEQRQEDANNTESDYHLFNNTKRPNSPFSWHHHDAVNPKEVQLTEIVVPSGNVPNGSTNGHSASPHTPTGL